MSCCRIAVLPTPLVVPLGVSECTPPVETDYSFENGLEKYLTGNDKLFCLIAGRVFPYYVPRDVEIAEFPCITYEVHSVPVPSITGQSGVMTATVDLDCWAPSINDACRVAEAVRQAMQGFRGWFGNVAVVGSWFQNQDDTNEEPKDNGGTYWFCRTMSFDVTYLVPIHSF